MHPETPPQGTLASQLNPDLDINDIYRHLQQMGEEYGLVFNPIDLIPNSRLALEATACAEKHGASETLKKAFFRAFFTEGRNISTLETVLDITATVGLDTREVENALQTGTYTPIIRNNAAQAADLEVKILPTYVFSNGTRVVGARPYKDFVRILEAWHHHQLTPTTRSND